MSRRALLVGINTYQNVDNLDACINDASAMEKLLERNYDKELNYTCRVLLDRMEDGNYITQASLRQACGEFFANFKGELLFYFSGHGVLTPFGGHLCTYDTVTHNWGISMQELVQLCINSKASEILLILDCCHSGDFANPSIFNPGGTNPLAVLREDMTVIAASRDAQKAVESGGHGLFTAAVLDALEGGAADHMGWVTAPSIYSYVERRFGLFDQRPVFKTNATQVTVVRECAPLINRLKLHELVVLFPSANFQYQLDPEYDPEDENGVIKGTPNEEKLRISRLFKEYRDVGLLKPTVEGEQLFWTAKRSHTVQLTARGREYWNLVKSKRI